jgi:two-component system cell cycle sensor histidine kinase/response regulator CckA
MNKGSILVVEDTLASLKLLSEMLTAEGYQVRPAQSGELALDSVAAKIPDLILLDIRMPGIDGYEVLRRLKAGEVTRNIPIIILSAITEREQHIEGLKLGAVDFLNKPYEREELLAKVHTQVELTRVRAELERHTIELDRARQRARSSPI